MSNAYKSTSRAALQVLTGISPLPLQLASEVEFSGVTTSHLSFYYLQKASRNTFHPSMSGIQLKDASIVSEIDIFTDDSKCENSVGAGFSCYLNGILINT